MSEPSPPDLTGQRLGHFRVDGLIGRGGMSTLYRATDERLGRRVALKVIDPVLAADAEFRERFVDEARNTSAVDHAHVVPLYDFDEADGRLYIAMRFVEGADLAALVDGRPLEPGRALRLLDQVADALDAVHAHGLVHLDVKPANVLVTNRESVGTEHVYLADFGLTRRGATGHRTSGGDFLGSPTYAAPEHLRGEPVDARTDLYSLTCVLFTCLTGRAPYLGSVTEVIDAHLAGRVPTASALLGSSVSGSGSSGPSSSGAGPSGPRSSGPHPSGPSSSGPPSSGPPSSGPPSSGPHASNPSSSGSYPALGPALDEVVRRGMSADPARRHASARALLADARAALQRRPPPPGHGPRPAGATGPHPALRVPGGPSTGGPSHGGPSRGGPSTGGLAAVGTAPGGRPGTGPSRPAGPAGPAEAATRPAVERPARAAVTPATRTGQRNAPGDIGPFGGGHGALPRWAVALLAAGLLLVLVGVVVLLVG